MNPEQYQPLSAEAHAWLDGRLEPEAKAAFEALMAADADLRARVGQVQSMIAMLRSLPVRQPRPGFDQRVMARIQDAALADQARLRIVGARRPIWQPIVQVAAGAVAAAVVIALTGLPGVRDTVPAPDALVAVNTGAEPIEDDLLPSLGDQYARYRRVATNLAALESADADAKRTLLRIDLEQSDILRRNAWLLRDVAALPMQTREEYERFVVSLGRAMEAIDREVTSSAAAGREPDVAQIRQVLAQVHVPRRLHEQPRIEIPRRVEGADQRVASAPGADRSDLSAYAEVHSALHSNDPARIVVAGENYLRQYGQGRFVKPAAVAVIAAHMRLGQVTQAAARYRAAFGEYAEHLTDHDAALLREALNIDEFARLGAALRAPKSRD